MWVLGFALGGCEWAIRKADTGEFKDTMRQWAREQKQERLVAAIESCERRLAELREELRIV
jgi:phage gp16-like protein